MNALVDHGQFAHLKPLFIDVFCGSGGTSEGVKEALGRSPDFGLNHKKVALGSHAINHPETVHLLENVWKSNIETHTKGRKVGALWASPDCRHFSNALGGKPKSKSVRMLPWSIIRFVHDLGKNRPDVIFVENVPEFLTWEDFKKWRREFLRYGYIMEWRMLRACDFGDPTIRKRLIIIMRRDGNPIIWPAPSHGSPDSAKVKSGVLKPWRTAAEIIDWSIPCPSIFDSRQEIKDKFGLKCVRPLAENTMRRIAAGVVRRVIEDENRFYVPRSAATGSPDDHSQDVANLIQVGYGERKGQKPRVLDIKKPLGTVVAGGGKFALVSSFLSPQYSNSTPYGIDDPVRTIMTKGAGGKQALITAYMAQHNLGNIGRSLNKPLSTVTTSGSQQMLVTGDAQSASEFDMAGATRVAAFLLKYYGSIGENKLSDPLHTVTTKDRFGLVQVTIRGEQYIITDITMRMLSPRELYRAQGFGDHYIIDRQADGTKISKSDQISNCGNAVPPGMSAACVGANCGGWM